MHAACPKRPLINHLQKETARGINADADWISPALLSIPSLTASVIHLSVVVLHTLRTLSLSLSHSPSLPESSSSSPSPVVLSFQPTWGARGRGMMRQVFEGVRGALSVLSDERNKQQVKPASLPFIQNRFFPSLLSISEGGGVQPRLPNLL